MLLESRWVGLTLALAIGVVGLAIAAETSLWDRDEPRFAQAAVEMVHSRHYLVPTFEGEPRLAQVAQIESALRRGLAPCRDLPLVRDVRVRGAIGVVELDRFDVCDLRRRFVAKGAFVRPFGRIIYLAPAFTIAPDELDFLMHMIVQTIGEMRVGDD